MLRSQQQNQVLKHFHALDFVLQSDLCKLDNFVNYQGVILYSEVIKSFLESHAVSTCMKLAGSLILKAGLQCVAVACANCHQCNADIEICSISMSRCVAK